jgi:hypothetical protein
MTKKTSINKRLQYKRVRIEEYTITMKIVIVTGLTSLNKQHRDKTSKHIVGFYYIY